MEGDVNKRLTEIIAETIMNSMVYLAIILLAILIVIAIWPDLFISLVNR